MTSGVMVDVGAHRGTTSSPFLEAGWQVYAFEPDNRNRAELEAWLGTSPNLVVSGLAVSDESSADVPFFRSEISAGISGLIGFHESHEESGTVSVTTLAEFFERHGITSVDFLKVDTEGNDLRVLRGLDLSRCQPQVIIAEFDEAKAQNGGHRLSDLVTFLDSNGYGYAISEWHPVTEYGSEHSWRGLTSSLAELASDRAWGNVIATRDKELLGSIVAKLSSAKS
ncbi:MAG: FkbM family methyltransferase [Actinomycetota bacterium]